MRIMKISYDEILLGFILLGMLLVIGFVTDMLTSKKETVDVVVVEKVYKPENSYVVSEYDVALDMVVTKTKTEPEEYILIVTKIDGYQYSYDDGNESETFNIRVSADKYTNIKVGDQTVASFYYGGITGKRYNFN